MATAVTKISTYILVLITFITCNIKKDNPTEKPSMVTLEQKNDVTSKNSKEFESFLDCDFVYDTIKNKKYNMHLGILEKFNDETARGYYISAKGDTLNKFLYHQDIAAFIIGLDSDEEGIYKQLTNKVVFLILEQEAKILDYGLNFSTHYEKQLNYFMEHVAHPICKTMSTDKIIEIIQREMSEPNENVRKIKKILIEKLIQNKK